jgi:hypothetical protein
MTNKSLSTGYTQNSCKPNPRASSRSRIQRTKTLLQKNQRTRMMKKRKMTMSHKLPENTREAREEATKADTETIKIKIKIKEDTTGDLITKDVMAEDITTVDTTTIQSMDITDTEANTVTEDTMVITVTEEDAD